MLIIKKAQKVRNIDLTNLEKALKTCDFVTMPTTPTAAFKSAPFKTL